MGGTRQVPLRIDLPPSYFRDGVDVDVLTEIGWFKIHVPPNANSRVRIITALVPVPADSELTVLSVQEMSFNGGTEAENHCGDEATILTPSGAQASQQRSRNRKPAVTPLARLGKPTKPSRHWNAHLRSAGARSSGAAVEWFRDREFSMQAVAAERPGSDIKKHTGALNASTSAAAASEEGRCSSRKRSHTRRHRAPRIEIDDAPGSKDPKSKSHSFLLLRNDMPAVYALVGLDGAGVLANIATAGQMHGKPEIEIWTELDEHLARPCP